MVTFRDMKAFGDDFAIASLGMSRFGETNLMLKIFGHSAFGMPMWSPFDVINDGYLEMHPTKGALATTARYVTNGAVMYIVGCSC